MPRALISVSDKRELSSFARSLLEQGWEIIASGGSAQNLEKAGIAVTPVESLTGLPEMLGGRVKTLHPAIHAGILARRQDNEELATHGFAAIDLVACNLYPFRQALRQDIDHDAIIEQIDIGGVALLRAAAKNYARVTVLCDPNDYAPTIAELRNRSAVSEPTRARLAAKAFAHTRDYDAAIYSHLRGDARGESRPPAQLSFELGSAQALRYGENPHQTAAFYPLAANEGQILAGKLLSGKMFSYNNLLDLDAAWRAASSFPKATVVIVKHRTPTGIASAQTPALAFPAALKSDPLSAFGGVLAVNREVTVELVSSLGSLFIEAIAAPQFHDDAQIQLNAKRPNCRLLAIEQPHSGQEWELRSVHGGLLVQRADMDETPPPWRVVTQRVPSEKERRALAYAWAAVRHVPSNAIVLANERSTLGIGGGLPSRVDAVQLACAKAGAGAKGAALASDAFFPFPDGLQVAAAAGVRAVIQPGGSRRDAAVIAAADAADITMVFSGRRHFRH